MGIAAREGGFEMRIKNCLLVTIIAVMMVFAMMPMTADTVFADSEITESQVFQYQNTERGVTVVPNGNIYTITEDGYMRVFNSSGGSVFSVKLPSSYCGNLCSASDGTVFAHTFADGGIYIFSPGSSQYKKVYAGSNCEFLATDSNGYLYNINSTGKSDANKSATVIFRAKISDVRALSSGSTIKWEESFQPEYTPPAASGICYPQAIDVDSAGNAYIVDMGSSNGYDSSVSGIYKYNLKSGAVTALRFTDGGNVGKLKWLKSVSVDDYGNVAVVARNSNIVAVFRNGSTIADKLVSVPGYCEDVDSDSNGDFYYNVSKNGTASKNGIYKISMNNISVTGLNLSVSEQSVVEGAVFTLTATVSPANSTNKTVLFSSSDKSVATVSDSGVVTGVKAGTAVITARTAQGGITKQCTVTVTKAPDTGGSGSSGTEGETISTTTVSKVTEGAKAPVNAGNIKITSVKNKTVAFIKANNKKSVTVPDIVNINGIPYKVTQIEAKAFIGKAIRTVTIGKNVKKIKKNAFKGSKATKMIVKTKKLTKKASVKGSLKGSKIKTVQVKVGKKSVNKKYVKKYKKVFTKKNAGKKVTVK